MFNQIDSVQGQLWIKLAALEQRLCKLLNEYIYAGSNGWMQQGPIPASQSLYGWILLEMNNLDMAKAIYLYDKNAGDQMTFSELHTEVMGIFKNSNRCKTYDAVLQSEFFNRGLSNSRAYIAEKLYYYLMQTNRIRQYIDELTEGSDNDDPHTATVDVKSLLFAQEQ